MTGKGKHHTVPLIFPPDTVPSIQKLVDPKIRIISGVLKGNNYDINYCTNINLRKH